MLDDIDQFFILDDFAEKFILSDGSTSKTIIGYFDIETQTTDYGSMVEHDESLLIVLPTKYFGDIRNYSWTHITRDSTGKTFQIRFAGYKNNDPKLVQLFVHDQ